LGAFLDILHSKAGVVDLDAVKLLARPQLVPSAPPSPANIEQMRQQLLARRSSADPKNAKRQEVEDAAIATAELSVEIEVGQADYDALTVEIEDYCNQNPWDCEGTSVEAPPFASGPSPCGAKSRCYEKAVTVLAALGGAVVTHLAVAGAITDAAAAGVAVSSLTVASWFGAVFVAGFGVGYTGAAYYDCWRQRTTSPNPVFDLPVFDVPCGYEPAY